MQTLQSTSFRFNRSMRRTSTRTNPGHFLAVATAALSGMQSTIQLLPPLAHAFQPLSFRFSISSSSSSSSSPSTTTRRRNGRHHHLTDNSFFGTFSSFPSELFSSVGGPGGDRRPPSDNNNSGGGGGDLGDFLDPTRRPDSENLQRAREFMSETSLPLSFDTTSPEDDDVVDDNKEDDSSDDENDDEFSAVTPTVDTTSGASSSLTAPSKFNNSATSSALFGTDGSPSLDILAKNPYMQVVSKISPSEVIAKFTATANPRVQDAVRTTILGLIGSLPKLAFETTTITTGQRLASLMFQLQMTGYMFKNAEYRISMSQSLGMYSEITSNLLLTGAKDDDDEDDDEAEKQDPLLSGKIKGKLKIRYGRKGIWTPRKDGDEDRSNEVGSEIEVDAAAYMSELRSEVSKLRDELATAKEAKEEALRKDLLLYIRTLPAQELKSLTNTMSQDVLVCMKGLVQAVLAGIGDGQIGPDTVTEQSGEAMAQLCMWQLAVGYNLREMEVREEMKKNLKKILGENDSIRRGDPSEPGVFE